MSVNAEYNYNKVLEQIRDEYRNIKNSDEYKHASRRTKEKIDNIFEELHADYLNKERALSETYRAIEEQDLAQERVEEGRKARRETNPVSKYLGDFAKSAGEHTVNDILKLTALGQQTLGYKDAAQKTAQLSQDISENMEDAFGRKAEWTTKENEWRPDSLESAIDAGLSTAIDVGTLIYSPLNAGANMVAGKAAALGGQKVAEALGNGIVGKLAGGAVNAIPTSVAMSLPELYGDQFDFDEYGNVILPKSVLPTYLLSIPHGMVEHLGIDPRKPFTQTIRKSIWKALKDYANPINIAKRAGGEGLEEGLQDAMSMFNKRASDATGTDKSIMQVMGEWMADVEEKYPQLLQSVFLGGIGGALMFEDAGNIKSNKELRAQRQNVQRQINDILAITDNLEITNSDADRNQLINDIDRALQGYDVRIADNSVSMAARQQAAKDKQNDQEQQQLVRLKQEQDKAADMLNNYVYNMDAQNVADNSNKSRFLNLPFADNNDYDYNTIYDNLVGEALAQQLRDNTERNKGNQEKYLQEWNTMPEEQQGQYKDANEYIAERMATDEEANDIESRRTEFAQEYANLSPEDRAKYKDSADYVNRRVNKETQKQRQKSNIGRSSRMLSAITSQRNKQERINRQQSRAKEYKATVQQRRENERRRREAIRQTHSVVDDVAEAMREVDRTNAIETRLKREQDEYENEKTSREQQDTLIRQLNEIEQQRNERESREQDALNEFRLEQRLNDFINASGSENVDNLQNAIERARRTKDIDSVEKAIELALNTRGRITKNIATEENNQKAEKRTEFQPKIESKLDFIGRVKDNARKKMNAFKASLRDIQDKDSDYFKEVAAADYMIETLVNELNNDLTDSEIHEIIEAIDDLYNRFFYLGEKEQQEQPQQQNNEYEEYADEIAQHEAEREQPQTQTQPKKNETTTIQMKNDLKGRKLDIKTDINTGKAERNSSIDSRLNERMTFRDREDSSKSMPQNIGNIIQGDMSQRFSREDIANSVETARQKAEQIARALGLGEQSKPNMSSVEEKDEKASGSEKANNSDTTEQQKKNETPVAEEETKPVEQKQEDADKYENYSFKRKTSKITKEQSDAIIGGKTVNIIKSLEVTKGKDGYRMNFGLTSLSRSFYPIGGEQIIYTKDRDIVDRYAKAIEEADKNGIILDFGDLRKSIEENKQQQSTQQAEAKPADNRIFKEDEFQKRMARLRSAANRVGVNPFADPQIVEDALYCSCYLIESGARKFADYCKHMVENLGEQAKVFKDYLAGFYMMAKKDPRLKALNIDKKEFSTEDEVDSFDIDSLFAKPVEEQQKEDVAEKETTKETKDEGKEAYDNALSRYQNYKVFHSRKGKQQSFEEWLNGRIELLENSNPNAAGVTTALNDLRQAKEYYEKNIKQQQTTQAKVEAKEEDNEPIVADVDNIDYKTTVVKLSQKLGILLTEAKDNVWLRKVLFGRKTTKDENRLSKLAQELFEGALCKYIRDNDLSLEQVLTIYKNQPTLSNRTISQIDFQAYSTPVVLAKALTDLLEIKANDTVLEPTAGNGLLLSSVNPSAKFILNEIQNDRREILQGIFGNVVTDKDALEMDMPNSDFVVTNPPFGKDTPSQDIEMPMLKNGGKTVKYKLTDKAHIIAAKALKNMKADGKAVIIYGAPNGVFGKEDNTRTGGAARFETVLFNYYNVVGAFELGKGMYYKQGTDFPIACVVIDGKRDINHNIYNTNYFAPRRLSSWQQVFDECNNIKQRMAEGVDVLGNKKTSLTAEAQQEEVKEEQPHNTLVEEPQDDIKEDYDLTLKEYNAYKARVDNQDVIPFDEYLDMRIRHVKKNVEEHNEETTARLVYQRRLARFYAAKEYYEKNIKQTEKKQQQQKQQNNKSYSLKDLYELDKKNLGYKDMSYEEWLDMSIDSLGYPTDSKQKTYLKRLKQEKEKIRGTITNEVKQQAEEKAKKEAEHSSEKLNEELAEGVKEAENKAENKTEVKVDVQVGDGRLQARYEPVSTNRSVNALVPTNLAKAINKALNICREAYGDLTDFVAKMTGNKKAKTSFSAEQIDALALYADKLLNKSAMVCADQTGLGKGRVAAGSIQMSVNNGHIPFFCTEKDVLFSDLYRDLKDIGAHNLRPFFVNTDGEMTYIDDEGETQVAYKKISDTERENVLGRLAKGDLSDFKGENAKYDYIVGTYSQFQNKSKSSTFKTNAIDGLLSKGITDLILDEAHNAASNEEKKEAGQRGKKKKEGEEDTSRYGRFLKFTEKASSILFLSATWAKERGNMSIYSRAIGLSVKQISEQVMQGGQGMIEYLVMDMAMKGKYIRREQSFAGVQYINEVVTKNDEDIDNEIKFSDEHNENVVDVINLSIAISNFIKSNEGESLIQELAAEKYGENERYSRADADKKTLSATQGSDSPFSRLFNYVNNLLLSLKADRVADEAIKQIKAGLKPVIALQNTGASQLQSFVNMKGYATGQNITPMSMADVFEGMMIGRLNHIPLKSSTGQKGLFVDIPFDRIPEEIQENFNEIKNNIAKTNLKNLPGTPIDRLIYKIEKAGYSVGEVTGRKIRVSYKNDNKAVFETRPDSPKIRKDTVAKFNNGDIDCVILNESGSTGISLHSSENFIDKKQRIMLIAQPFGNINTMMQMLGRIHRVGQVSLPIYKYVMTSLLQEIRIANNLQDKLKSLNANTSSNKEGSQKFSDVDINNTYGRQAIMKWLEENFDIARELGLVSEDEKGNTEIRRYDTTSYTGRISVAPQAIQKDFWETILPDTESLIEEAKARGEDTLTIPSFDDTDAIVVESRKIKGDTVADDYYIKTLDIKIEGKPASIDNAEARALKGESIADNAEAMAELERKGEEFAEGTDKRIKNKKNININDMKNRIRSKNKDLLSLIRRTKIGSRMINEWGDVGIVTDVKVKPTKDISISNPLINSKVIIVMASPTKTGTTIKNAESFYREGWRNVDDGGYSDSEMKDFESSWNARYNDNSSHREQREAITGNLLNAVKTAKQNNLKVSQVQFRTKDGGHKMQFVYLARAQRSAIGGGIDIAANKKLEKISEEDVGKDKTYTSSFDGGKVTFRLWKSGALTISFEGIRKNSAAYDLIRKSEEYFGKDSWSSNYIYVNSDVVYKANRFLDDAKGYGLELSENISEEEKRRRSDEIKKNLPNEFEEDDVHFSISQSKVSKAIGINKLNSIAKKIGNALNQKLGLGLVVCKDSAELGNKLREAGAKIETIPQGAEGCVFNGNVYLVADNIQDGNRVYTVLAHEIAGHVGAEKIYPHFNALMKQLLKLENSDEKIKAIFDDVRKNYHIKDDEIRIASEVFAKVMEQVYENENSFTGKIKNLVNFFIKKVKDFFRSLFGMNIPMSASEVYAIANNIMKVTTVKSIMKGEVARTNIYNESKAFEKEPVFSNDESLKALGMSERNGKASWTDERINYLIDEYGSKSDNRYSQAYATTIDPVDFLKLTLGEKNYQRLWKQFPENFEVKDLNPEKLKGERQTPFLIVEGNAKDPTRIIGHEGRHILLALAKAGIKNVPVVVIDKDTKYNKEVMPPTELKNQKGQNNSIPSFKAFTQEQMIPIKESNRETLRKMFGGESDIQFSIPSDIFEFNAYLEREEKKQNNGSNVVQLSDMETFDKGVAEGKRLAEVERKEQQEKVKTAAKLAKLAKNRQKGLDYLAQQERVNKAIEESRKPKKTTLAQKVEAVENWLALKFANKRQRLVEFQDTIEKALGHKLADYMNPHRQLDTIDGRIQYRTEAFNNKYFKPLYDYLVKNGITYDDFNKFTYAMHADERDKYIREINPTFRDNNKRGSGWDNAKMGGTEQQVLDSLYQKYGQDKLMNAGKMFWNMNKAVIDLQEQYGLIDKKTADNIRARYKYYTPLKHIADDEVTTKVVERALGRTSTAQDNLMFATAAIDTTIRWGEKNNAKLAMLNLANVYKTPMVEINRQKLEQYFNPETGEVEIRLDRSKQDNTITARASGVNYNITFKDEELYKAFTSEQRTSEAWNAIVKTSRVFTNMMGFVSTMANPDFGIANFVRDQSQSGLENIVYRGMKFASNAFHYALPAIKTYIDYRRGIDNEDTRLYKEFLENGGLTGYADMLRLDKRAVNLDKSISEDIEANKGVLGKLKKLAKNPSDVIHGIFGLFEAFNDSLESATRFGVYREARKNSTALEAAELAKNITINFNRHGSLWSSDMNALYLFSNANIQGTRKAWQLLKYAARDNKGRSIIGSLVAAGFISEILGHMFAGFDPDDEVSYYDKLEEWKKDGNLVIFTGGKKYISMPLSPVVAFPYMIGRNTAAYMTGKKNMSTAIIDIFSNFITTLNPLGEDSKSLGSIVPTPMRPLVDLWTNKKWNAAKIRPEQTNGMKKPEHQLYFDNKTSKVFVDLAKWLSDVTGGDEYTGGKIDWSPADMQYLAENYSGGLGKSLYKGYKLATSQAESLDDIPLLRRFRGETNEYSTAKEYKDNQQIADRFSKIKSDRNFDYLNRNKSYIRISNIIKVADKQIDRIRERKNLSEAEKELAVTKIQKNANTAIRKLQ